MEDRLEEVTDAEQKRENRLKTNEESLRELWDNIKRTNIRIIGVPEGEEREKRTEKIFQEIIAENFPNMGKESLTQIHAEPRQELLWFFYKAYLFCHEILGLISSC